MSTSAPNFVLAKTFLKATILASSILWSSSKSTLFKTTNNFEVNNSAMMIHSAVCVWMPFVMSIMRRVRSIIWTPPMTVLIKDAWPGQSTNVNCKYGYLTSKRSGVFVKNAEKPKSRVIPRSCDCGFLSRLAVDATVVSIRQIEVFPESTCPRIPTLIFIQPVGWMVCSSSAVISSRSFYIVEHTAPYNKYNMVKCWV